MLPSFNVGRDTMMTAKGSKAVYLDFHGPGCAAYSVADPQRAARTAGLITRR